MPQKHVLLVDDSKSARFALRALLKKKGFTVDTAESGEHALEMIKEVKPDAIFMDHMMPGMDGFEATQAIKGDPSTAHIPVVMCTSNDQAGYVQEAKKMGSIGILPKPPTSEKLSQILDALDHEMGDTHIAKTIKEPQPKPLADHDEIKAVLQAILPTVIRESVEPLIDAKLQAHTDALTENILQQSADSNLTAIQKAISANSADGREQFLREARNQSERFCHESIANAINGVEGRLKEISTQFHKDLQREISTVSSRLSDDRAFITSIQSAVTSGAESKAIEVSRAQAISTAKTTAEEIALSAMSDTSLAFTPKFKALNRKINLLATGAALVGIISAAVVYLLPLG